MFRILWVYLNALFYIMFHIIPIRRRYKHSEDYSIEQKYQHIQELCELIVRKSGSKVIVEGRENIPNGPVLYVSNHPSMIDPYFISYAIKKQMGAVIAGDLWFDRIPILTPWFKSFGCIYVDRKNIRKGIEGICNGIENIKKGHSLLLFPEGEVTRELTIDCVGKYQSGGLKLATKAKVPIVPIVISGTDNIYATHEVFGKLKKGIIKIKILNPFVKHLSKEMSTQEIALELHNTTKEMLYKF